MLDGHGDSRVPCDLHPHTAHGCCLEKPNQELQGLVAGGRINRQMINHDNDTSTVDSRQMSFCCRNLVDET